MRKVREFLKKLGPGIITGAADDDPSGIATYALAGARFGFGMLWTAWMSFPLMAAVQEMCARIGLVTKKGLSGTLKSYYTHKHMTWFMYGIAILVFAANTLNVGADVAAMAASTKLLVGGVPEIVWAVGFVVIIGSLVIFGSYRVIAKIFKWLTLVLLLYIGSAFAAHLDWHQVLVGTMIPKIAWNKESVMMVVAILGTTISPYLFFWQASEEVEEKQEDAKMRGITRLTVTKNELKLMREDVMVGMGFSNLAMFFIIAATAGTLNAHGIKDIATPAQAALALTPIAGPLASLMFTLGVIGTGILAIPVLAGSAAYTVSEAFGWEEGLDKKWYQAKSFYVVFSLSMLLGLVLTAVGWDPISLLFYTAVVFGVISPPLIAAILLIANNKKIMGGRVNNWVSNILGGATLLVMSGAVIGMLLLS